ncbi:hypothetical protein M1513_01270, partial [Patescibacteria group bacterium]|nr:hypothetical protein [Patescibacteria group bacterium]
NGIGSVTTSSGSQSVSPTQTTVYTITATGPGGTATAQATVTVTPAAAAPTVTFSASPTSITSGQSSTLSWATTNATAVSIDNGIGSVTTSSGSQSVSPTQTTVYTITATGPGGTATAQATVTVNQPLQKLSPISISASGAPLGVVASAPILYNGENYTITSPSGGDIYYTYISYFGASSYPNGGSSLGSSPVSGTFSSSTARIIEFWAVSNGAKSDPIDVAVIPAPPSSQPQQPAPALEIDCQRSVTRAGKTTTSTIASLTIDPGIVVPPNGTTLTLSFNPSSPVAQSIKPWGCSVPIDNTGSNYAIGYTDSGSQSVPPTMAYPTSTTNYSLSCTSNSLDVCTNYVIKNKGNVVSGGGTSYVSVKIFGGSAGGLKEIAPQ